MTEMLQVYRCEKCGNIVKVVRGGVGDLVCCGQPMILEQEKMTDQGNEKHVPVIEKTANGILVKVGATAHPMLPEHHIEWIEVRYQDKLYVKKLEAGEKPEAEFCVPDVNVKAREYCNVHGLWTNKS